MPIPDYEQRLTPERAAELIGRGMGLAAAAYVGAAPGAPTYREIALVGGALYLPVMRACVDSLDGFGQVVPGARLVEINGEIGFMRRDLRRWLAGSL